MRPERILLVHLVANGDCLMATTIARQLNEASARGVQS